MNFQERVYYLTRKVPKGKVTTYKELARIMNTRGYQAVGQALKSNANPVVIPCHRVIKSDGSLGGYAGKTSPLTKEIKRKARLLKREGVKIEDNKIDLKKYFFSLK